LVLATSQTSNMDLTKITLTETATMSVAPNTAMVCVGIVTDGKTCKDASQNNSKKSDQILKLVKKFLQENDTIQTQDYSVSLQYTEYKKIRGCQVSNSLIISTKNVKNVGSIIDNAITAGANQINFLSFILSDCSQYESEVYLLATKNAVKKVNQVASAIGGSISYISSIQENQMPSTQVYYSAREASTPTSIEVGLLQISGSVTIEAYAAMWFHWKDLPFLGKIEWKLWEQI